MTDPLFDKSANSGVRHLVNATRFSWQGLKSVFRNEAAFRQELALLIVLIPAGVWIADSVLDFVLLIGVGLLVLLVELVNSAVEAIVDRVGEEPHRLSGLAKDYGSAAVMLSLIIALLVWGGMLFERLQ